MISFSRMQQLPLAASLAYLLIFTSASSSIRAQAQATGSQVNVSAQKQISVKPTRLRLILPIQVEGRELKESVAALAAFKERVKKDLVSMNADPESIQLEANTMSSYIAGGPDPSAGGRIFVPTAEIPGRTLEDGEDVVRIYVARSSIQADWLLPTQDWDALSLLPEELKRQVQERDLQGKKQRVELSEEEQELADAYARRLTQMRSSGGYYTTQAAQNTDAQIYFWGVLSMDDEKKGLGEAYKEAEQSAKLLAEAAGRKLGELKSLTRSDSASTNENAYFTYDAYGNQVRQMFPRLNSREVISLTPSKLTRTITVTVSFSLD